MSILKLKDSQGNWVGVPTLKGDKGNGISSAVLNNDYTLTLTFTDGTTYTTSSIRGEKGEKGEPATDMDIHICSASEYDSETRIPTIVNPDDKTFYLVPTEDGTSPDLFTEWVYVNNAWEMFGSASVDLTDYVKNIDYATQSIAGVVRVNDKFGILLGSNGLLMLDPSTSTDVKAGTEAFKTLTPYNQSASTFYGLAKASGHDEKDSELPVGQYTDEAKSSIQDMLDVPSTSELKEVNDSKADVIVESASGDIVSFNDGADGMPLKSLVVDINPVQNLNGYDHPWVGGGGKNLFDATLMRDREAWYNIAVKVKPSTKYTMSTDKGTQTSTGLALYFNNTNTQGGGSASILYSGNPVTVTSTEDGYVYVSQRRVSGEDSFQNYHYQIEEGNTATDWTPYENICPISGWTEANILQTGKNLLPNLKFQNAPSTVGIGQMEYVSSNQKIYLSAGTYTLSTVTTASGRCFYKKKGGTNTAIGSSSQVNPNGTFTITETGFYAFWIYNGNGFSADDLISFQLEKSATATEYEPYKGRIINVNWEPEAGTIYSGQLDVLSGVMTISTTMLDMGTLTWVKDANRSGIFYTSSISNISNSNSAIMCSSYIVNNTYGAGNILDGALSSMESYGTKRVFVKDMTKTDLTATQFKTEMDGVQLICTLATPIEYQFTPQEVKSILGQNNIWADTGNISVEYCADTEMYIEKVKPVVNVDDVQINGQSIVTDGVANVPMATSSTLGTVIANASSGIGVRETGHLYIDRAYSNAIKVATEAYRPIVPLTQHVSTFYGLAKASGDTTQSASSNAVGNYTEEAKASIQNMLGITDKYSPKEWVAESETELVANAHNVGDLFYIGETLYKVIADLNAGDAINVGVNVEEVNANDILDDYATKEDVQDNVSIVEKSTSGAIATFDDGLDNIPLKELVVDINPIQDLHGYNSPWVGGGGKNLLAYPYETASGTSFGGLTVTYDDKGIFTINGTKTANGSWTIKKVLLSAGTYTLSIDNSLLSGLTVRAYDTNTGTTYATVTTSSRTFILAEDTEITFYFLTQSALTGDVNLTVKIQVEKGDVATDWTPYENICPISGWTGCEIGATGYNVWDEEWEQGRLANGNNYANSQGFRAKNYIEVKPNTKYYFYAGAEAVDSGNNWVSYYTKDKTYIAGSNAIGTLTITKNTEFTIPNNAYYMRFFLSVATEYKGDISINYPSTEHDYHPYVGRTIPINWQTEAGTVYGGSLNVLSGVLTVTHQTKTFDGSEDWRQTGAGKFYINKSLTEFDVYDSEWISNKYPYSGYKPNSNNMGMDNSFYTNYNSGSTIQERIFVLGSSFADVASFQASLATTPLTVCGKLKEPITVQLSPTEVKSLLGQNNIFADTGDTEVEYFSQVDEDLTDYIEANLNSYAKKELLNDYVNDIQIDGTNIVENGVVNMPTATTTNFGVMQLGSGLINNSSGVTMVNFASQAGVKTGSSTNTSISPVRQHESVFYGLTKAAGVDMSTSSNAIGTYTEEAKTAIKQMLGIHDIIDSFIEEVTGTDVTITGQPSYRYNCGELYSLTVTPPSSGTIDFRFTSGSTPTVLTLPQTVKMPEWWVEVEANTIYEMCITDGIYCGVMTWAI